MRKKNRYHKKKSDITLYILTFFWPKSSYVGRHENEKNGEIEFQKFHNFTKLKNLNFKVALPGYFWVDLTKKTKLIFVYSEVALPGIFWKSALSKSGQIQRKKIEMRITWQNYIKHIS